MDAASLLLLVPVFALPFVGERWSLVVTYFTFGPLAGYFILSIWLNYTNPSHMSDELMVISGLAAGICITMIALARVIQNRKAARRFTLPRTRQVRDNKMKKTVSLGLVLLVSLTGCSPQIEPMAQVIQSKEFKHLELVSNELVANCGASFGIPCSQPLYSIFFKASSSVAAEDVCRPVIELQSELGLDAFSAEGSSDIGEVKNVNQVIEFCIQGLEQDLGGSQGPSYFEGTVLYEDGSGDGLGKVTVISRREDGSYFVDFSLGRDKDRIGYFTIQGMPRHQVP